MNFLLTNIDMNCILSLPTEGLARFLQRERERERERRTCAIYVMSAHITRAKSIFYI